MNWLSLQTLAQVPVERVLNALPEGFLIACFAWALLRVFRRQNSGTRFAVWFLALLAVAVLPVLAIFGEGRLAMMAGMSPKMSWAPSWGSPRPALAIPAEWALFVFLAWILGAGAALLRLGAALWHLRQLLRSCTPIVAADLDPAVRKTIAAIGASRSVASRPVTVAASEHVRVPAAIGFCQRTIVLPAWALRELPPHDLNVILLHEFAHLRRCDDWTNLIQKIVRALFFFHPAVWWIEGRLSVEREMACDDAVLAETADPHRYANCLVSLLEKSLAHRAVRRLPQRQRSLAQAAVNRAREASLRLARILDANRPAATRVWKPALAIVGVFSLACLILLPRAPQFVAFDRAVPASDSMSASLHPVHVETGAPARPSRAQLGSGPQPQQLQICYREPSSAAATAKMTTAKVVPARVMAGRELAPAPTAFAPLNAPPPDQVLALNASVGREAVPEFQTLVFVEATEYATSNSSVWSVQIWRVTLVNVVGYRMATVPVASSI
ncbi:MAG: M56 family metallopeptidase [Terriglobales bacterium]|jgi:beta-lactamase regulating signal transducer with metallopeptidase domain